MHSDVILEFLGFCRVIAAPNIKQHSMQLHRKESGVIERLQFVSLLVSVVLNLSCILGDQWHPLGTFAGGGTGWLMPSHESCSYSSSRTVFKSSPYILFLFGCPMVVGYGSSCLWWSSSLPCISPEVPSIVLGTKWKVLPIVSIGQG
jgi:hypothetical protein